MRGRNEREEWEGGVRRRSGRNERNEREEWEE